VRLYLNQLLALSLFNGYIANGRYVIEALNNKGKFKIKLASRKLSEIIVRFLVFKMMRVCRLFTLSCLLKKVLGDQAVNLNMGAAEQKSVSAETLSDILPGDPITFPQRRADALDS